MVLLEEYALKNRRIVATVLGIALGALPALAKADVYVNAVSPGFRISSIHTLGCSSYDGKNNSAKCNDTATGKGAGITFVAVDPNGNCAGANPNHWPCDTHTWCFVKIGRHQSGAFGQTTHYDLLQIGTDVGGPSSTPGAISVGPQYKATRNKCTASWVNGNTIDIRADLLPSK